jgi:hypothetical protein
MRFSVASVALFAGAAVAMPAVQQYDTTVYSTKDVTVTSCPPSVTDCPTKKPSSAAPYVNPTSAPAYTTSTVYSTSYYTVTSCAPTVTSCPAHSTQIYTSVMAIGTTVCPVSPTSSSYATPPPYPTSAAPAPPAVSPVSPSVTVITYTTCIPTVTSKTVTVSPTSYPSSANPIAPSVYPTGTISPVAPKPTYTSKPPPFTGAASSVSGSFAFAGIAALAAVFLA